MADLTKAYCAAADVESITQVTAYSTTTAPTLADVTAFCQFRAGTVYAWIREVAGTSAPGPTDYATTIDTSTDAGKGLDQAARDANATMAAVDALEAAGLGNDPNVSDRMQRMRERFERSSPDLPSPLEMAVKQAAQAYVDPSIASTHLSAGDETAADMTPVVEEAGLTFTSETDW